MDPRILSKSVVTAASEAARDYAVGAAVGAVVLWLLPSWLRCICLFLGALAVLSCLITPALINWKPRRRVQVTGKAVVITGCDSGFGHMLAQRLDDLGFHVFAGCLFPDGEGADRLKKSGSTRLHVFGLDVTNDHSVQEAVTYVNDNLQDQKLWAVVCNAGINDGAELYWTNLDIIQRVIDVNTFGVIRVTKAFLTQLRKNSGRVVAVASSAGRYTFPGMVPYCMSKQAVISFCDGLRLEMYKFGVKVVTIEPWMYKTNIIEEESVYNYLNRTWEKAPEEIKAEYPPNYLDGYKKATKRILNFSTSHNPNEVVSCLEEAVMAENPKYSYQPGTLLSKLSFAFYSRLPKAIADLVISSTFLSKAPLTEK